MLDLQFDLKKKALLKEQIISLREKTVDQVNVDVAFTNIKEKDFLFLLLDVLSNDTEITAKDIKRFIQINPIITTPSPLVSNHPLQLLKEENIAFQFVLKEIEEMITLFSNEPNELQNVERINELEKKVIRLGEFHKHYHRKEKLIFPIMERYGYHSPIRKNWLLDDQIRAFYQAMKKQIIRLSYDDFARFQTRYKNFVNKFQLMIAMEELLLFPIFQLLLTENDWHQIADESDAFGYAIIHPPIEKWTSSHVPKDERVHDPGLVYGGGGFLTTKEAELIFNQLPLEITFVDKNDVFKYFNHITEASDMMLVRTPISIGRNVANCHPPKSLKKVMQLVRDLKSGKRESESMWFKMRGKYIHLTYKGLFDEDGQFLGILEYVQDIQPFFELSSEQKRGLTRLDDE